MDEEIGKIGIHNSLKNKVYEHLKSLIITGKLKPKRRLREAELSEAMNISRGPIREALTLLEKESLVTIVPRKGTIVSIISEKEVENIWEVRSLLESYAASDAAKKFEEDELDEIENELKRLKKEPYDFSGYINSDLKLHEFLYKNLDNKILKDIIGTVRQNSMRILNFAQGQSALSKDIVLKDIKEHLEIIKALRTRDPNRTSDTVFKHIINSKQRIIQALEEIN
jgi:DNA-binding GntR family transcriptional regulator